MRIEVLAGGANSLPSVSRHLASIRTLYLNSNRFHYQQEIINFHGRRRPPKTEKAKPLVDPAL